MRIETHHDDAAKHTLTGQKHTTSGTLQADGGAVMSGLVYGLCNYPDDNGRTLLLQLAPKPTVVKGYGRCHLGNCRAHIQAQTLQVPYPYTYTCISITAPKPYPSASDTIIHTIAEHVTAGSNIQNCMQ